MGAKAVTPPRRFGTWLARADNTIYQAATDGFVLARCNDLGDVIEGYTDGANPPTTLRPKAGRGGNTQWETFTMPVRKNDYWKTVNADNIWWIPLEP